MSIAYSLNSIDYALTPNLLNLNQNDAKNLVEKEGLIAEVTYIPVNDSSLNKKVLSQEPIPGVFVQKNSKIKMVVGSIGIVAITSPKVNGSEVGNITTISGLVQNLKNGEKVYVLVQPQPVSGDGPYVWYIQPTPSQPTPLTIKPDGTWKCNVYLGKTGDINRQFKIVAIITDKNLTSSDNQFELPDNQAVSDPIYVTRVQ